MRIRKEGALSSRSLKRVGAQRDYSMDDVMREMLAGFGEMDPRGGGFEGHFEGH